MPKSQIMKLTLKHLLKIEQFHLHFILIILVQIVHTAITKHDKCNKYIYCILLKIFVKCLVMLNFDGVLCMKFEAVNKYTYCIFRYFICLRILLNILLKIMEI